MIQDMEEENKKKKKDLFFERKIKSSTTGLVYYNIYLSCLCLVYFIIM